jgi:hypothetical protein
VKPSLTLAAALCLLAFAPLGAESAPESPEGNAAEAARLARQKETLVRRLLAESPAARRIESSGDVQARDFLATARSLHAKAVSLLESGDAAGADATLNDAMWFVGKARQLVPDAMHHTIEQRVRYAQLLASVQSLRLSYEGRFRGEIAPPAERAALGEVSRLVDGAKDKANAEQYADANLALMRAESVLLGSLTRLLGSETLEYTARFAGAADEFAYELARNRGLTELVPVAIEKLRPSPQARRLVDLQLENSSQMRDAALQQAARKEYAAALASVRLATRSVERALAATGLVLPRQAGEE